MVDEDKPKEIWAQGLQQMVMYSLLLIYWLWTSTKSFWTAHCRQQPSVRRLQLWQALFCFLLFLMMLTTSESPWLTRMWLSSFYPKLHMVRILDIARRDSSSWPVRPLGCRESQMYLAAARCSTIRGKGMFSRHVHDNPSPSITQ